MTIRWLGMIGIAALVCSFSVSNAADDVDGSKTYEMLDLFGDVFERTRADYVDEVTDDRLIEAAINGMLTALDPHSGYLNPEKFNEMKVQTQGTFGGLGIEVTMEGGLVKVVSPIDDTPAHEAGLQPGDFITHLDGEHILGMALEDAVEKMRGVVGTQIRLTIRRGNQKPFDVTLTRAVIKIQSVRSHLEGKVGYLRISSFSEQTASGVKEHIEQLKKDSNGELQGLVLDLRNDPGGLLSQAIAVSDAFLEQGEIVSTRARKAEDAQRFNARPGDLLSGLPMVVLINAGSASASEIVAGALQDHGRAILLGTKSFGKGSVQTIIPLTGHGAMRLTTARYYTPSGRSIQAVGIEPDIVVEQARVETVSGSQQRREADLPGALDRGLNGDGQGTPDAGQPSSDGGDDKAPPATDYQLQRAIDLVRGVSLFGNKTQTGSR
ncbi:MAG: S41 family peptidase [Hyphomicrobiales bacterium]|nr:S41 family peptidase [Hyphomicrobiales bacterium]